MKSIIAKYTDLLRSTYESDGIDRCLSKASFQIETMVNMDTSSHVYYFSRLIDNNLSLAVHIFILYQSRTELSTKEIRDLFFQRISTTTNYLGKSEYNDLKKTKSEIRESINGGLSETKKKADLIRIIDRLYAISDLCFASLALDFADLTTLVFELVKKHIKDDASCDKFVDRICTQINHLSEALRGKVAIRFLSNTYKKSNQSSKSSISLKMAIRFRVHSAIMGKSNLEEAYAFLRRLLNDKEYIYLRHVSKIVPWVSFESFALSDEDFIRSVISCYPDQITGEEMLAGVRLSERLYSQSHRDKTTLNQWWRKVCNAVEQNASFGKEGKEYLRLFYLLRRIEYDPYSFDSNEPLADVRQTINLKHISGLQQEVTAILFSFMPDRAKEFLLWLGKWNFYAFSEDDYRFKQCNHDDNVGRYIEALSYYYSDEDLIYIYMNSYLRSSLPIRILFKIIYDHFDKQREDHMMVENLFKNYRMIGRVRQYSGTIQVEPVSFVNDNKGVSIYEESNAILHELDQYYQAKNSTAQRAFLHFRITAFSVRRGFYPEVHLDYSDFMTTRVKDLNSTLLEEYINSLRIISTKEEVDKETISVVEKMPAIKISLDTATQIGLEIIRCCNRFDYNRQRVGFLKRLGFNPYDISRYSSVKYSDLQKNYVLNSFFYEVVKDKGFFEDKFYLYCNSPLRTNYYLDYFIRKAEPLNGRFTLGDIFATTQIYFMGTVDSIVEADKKHCAIINPSLLIAGKMSKYVCYIDNDNSLSVGDVIKFVIDYYDSLINTFVIKKYQIREKHNTYFVDAMAKASSTINLGIYDTYNLGKPTSMAMIKNDIWRLAILEAEAIKLRKDSIDSLETFLGIIRKGNPWTFSTNSIPCIFNKYKPEFVESMINDFIRVYPIEFVIKLYFNTSLRSFMPLEDFLVSINAINKLCEKTLKQIGRYPICISAFDQRIVGENVYLENDPIVHPPVSYDARYYVVGVDTRKKRIKLAHNGL